MTEALTGNILTDEHGVTTFRTSRRRLITLDANATARMVEHFTGVARARRPPKTPLGLFARFILWLTGTNINP